MRRDIKDSLAILGFCGLLVAVVLEITALTPSSLELIAIALALGFVSVFLMTLEGE